VRENIMKRVKTEEMGDLIYEVLVPTERVSGNKKEKERVRLGNFSRLSDRQTAPAR